MSNRRNIEKLLSKEILKRLSPWGFRIVDSELNQFEFVKDNIKWGLIFHLWNNNIYSLFCKAEVRYIDLTEIIKTLLIDTEFYDYFNCGIGIINDELRITNEKKSLKIADSDDIDAFSEVFFERIEKIRDLFWIPQSEPINQMESFKKPVANWVNGDFIQNCAIWISTGIKNNNVETVKYGFERGYEIIFENEKLYGKNYHGENEKLLMDILYKIVKNKGFDI
jgi:hypothetical protein